jgi:hypothetical protein
MIVRKTLLGAVVAALTTTPAWALPAQAPTNRGMSHAHDSTPGGPGGKSSSNSGANHGNGVNHGKSHKCASHNVGYVATGSLEAQTLTENSDGTFSGELEVLVAHTNHHAAREEGKVVTYTANDAHLTFGLADTNSDGGVGLDDLAKGDRVQLLGRISVLVKKCPSGEFTQVMKVHRIVFHAPLPPAPSKEG